MRELVSVAGVAAPGPGLLEAVDLVSARVETLHGQGDCRESLRRLSHLVGASGAEVLRFEPGSLSPHRLLSVSGTAGRALPDRYSGGLSVLVNRNIGLKRLEVARSHGARDLIADGAFHQTALAEDHLRDAALADAVVVILERRGMGRHDVLELHYRTAPTTAQRRLLDTLAATLARRWAARQPGISRRLRAAGRPTLVALPVRPSQSALLGYDNPAGLTRAEYRLCVLLRDGVSPADLAASAGIRPSTAKSHLRSIYDKTGCRGRAELMQRLMGEELGAMAATGGPSPRIARGIAAGAPSGAALPA